MQKRESRYKDIGAVIKRVIIVGLVICIYSMAAYAETITPENGTTDQGDAETHNYILVSQKDPTCTQKGYRVFRCKDCGKEGTESIDTLEHDYEVTDMVAPTCTKDGVQVSKCKVCGKTDRKTLESTGHQYDEEVLVQPTCESKGLALYTCKKCGETKTEKLDKTDHVFKEEVTEPTCVEVGRIDRVCEVCGYEEHEEFGELAEHTFVHEVIKQPTCTEEGVDKLTCTVCGTIQNEKIEPRGHHLQEYRGNGDCTKAGYAIYMCSECGMTYTNVSDRYKIHCYDLSISAAESCDINGSIEVKCTKCGKEYFSNQVSIGHRFKTSARSMSYDKNGYTKYICESCGKMVTRIVSIDNFSSKR